MITRGRGKWNHALFVDLANEIFKHDLGDIKLRDNPITNGAHNHHIPGVRPTISLASSPIARGCLFLVNRNPGWLINDNALIANMDKGVRSAKVMAMSREKRPNSQLIGLKAKIGS
jgi:hypothetical protein